MIFFPSFGSGHHNNRPYSQISRSIYHSLPSSQKSKCVRACMRACVQGGKGGKGEGRGRRGFGFFCDFYILICKQCGLCDLPSRCFRTIDWLARTDLGKSAPQFWVNLHHNHSLVSPEESNCHPFLVFCFFVGITFYLATSVW